MKLGALYTHNYNGQDYELRISWDEFDVMNNGLHKITSIKSKNDDAAGDFYYGVYLQPQYRDKMIKWFKNTTSDIKERIEQHKRLKSIC